MKDQFGNDVPNDLVVVDSGHFVTKDDIAVILEKNWYECNGFILISSENLDESLYLLPEDCDLEIKEPIYYIGNILKRWNPIDGFYHA